MKKQRRNLKSVKESVLCLGIVDLIKFAKNEFIVDDITYEYIKHINEDLRMHVRNQLYRTSLESDFLGLEELLAFKSIQNSIFVNKEDGSKRSSIEFKADILNHIKYTDGYSLYLCTTNTGKQVPVIRHRDILYLSGYNRTLAALPVEGYPYSTYVSKKEYICSIEFKLELPATEFDGYTNIGMFSKLIKDSGIDPEGVKGMFHYTYHTYNKREWNNVYAIDIKYAESLLGVYPLEYIHIPRNWLDPYYWHEIGV